MDPFIIAGIILTIVLSILMFKVIKKIIAAIAAVFILIFVATAALGLFVYMDVQDMKAHSSEPNMLLIYDNDTTLVNVVLKENTLGEGKSFELSNEKYVKDEIDYKTLHETYYKIIELDISTLEPMFKKEISLPFKESNITIDKTEGLKLIRSNDLYSDLADIIINKEELDSDFKDKVIDEIKQNDTSDQKIKLILIGAFLEDKIKNPTGLVKQLFIDYKYKKITISKKTMVFRLIDSVPLFLVEKLSNKVEIAQE